MLSGTSQWGKGFVPVIWLTPWPQCCYLQENKNVKDVGMACQKVCANKVGVMHESKGQYIGKAPSLHLFHTTVRQCMGVFLKRTTSSPTFTGSSWL